jgi:hypothetical protein
LGIFSKPANGIHILNGHRIALHNPQSGIFHRQLQCLKKQVRFIRFEEAVELIVRKTKVNEPLVAFSFDDGFEECYTQIAPVLEDFKTNAAFFINPNFVDGDEKYNPHYQINVFKKSFTAI